MLAARAIERRRSRRVVAWLVVLTLGGCSGGAPGNRPPSFLPYDGSVPDTPDAGVAYPAQRVLFIGNSFTRFNNLPQMYERLVLEARVRIPTLEVEAATDGSKWLIDHERDARDEGSHLSQALASPEGWTEVVIQAQSQNPTFPHDGPDFTGAAQAAAYLSGRAKEAGARVAFFMTWGYRDGDSLNPGISPDYETMQRRLEDGYRTFAERVRADGVEAIVVPVGLAFEAIYDEESAGGGDPLAEGSLFRALYGADGRHPSVAGTYLAALVFAGTFFPDVDLTKIEYEPSGLPRDSGSRLRAAAQRTLAADRERTGE